MSERSVPNLAAVNALDQAEIIEGYWEGRRNEPEPGGNRSLAHWHGWRCRMSDAYLRAPDDEMMQIAREFVAASRSDRGHRP